MQPYTTTPAAVEIDPATILWGQLNTLLMPVPGDDQVPAEVEPTGPTAADAAWWAENAPRPDDAGPMGERWTPAPSGWPTDEDCLPGRIG